MTTQRLLLILVLAITSAAQTPALTTANQLLQQQKWSDAASAFRAIVTSEPNNAIAWKGLGEAQLQQKQYDDAEKSFSRAVEMKVQVVANRMNLARVAAARGDKPRLFGILRALIADGFGGRARNFLSYPEFNAFREDADMKKLVAEEMLPCRGAHFRDFDFWVGEWDVYDPQEKQRLGHNSVTSEQEGCLLVEHWKSGQSTESGSSFNYFDLHDSTWHQVYISNSGDARSFPPMVGGLVDGKMTMLTALDAGKQSRWTWYVLAPGKVRQMAEFTTDAGKTWSITWDSVYKKVDHVAVSRNP